MQHDASDPISIPSPSASDCGPGGLPVDDYDADCSPSPPKDVENKEAEVEADVAEAESRAATVSRKRDVKNGQSYIAMIAKAILASPEKKLSLHGIYEYVAINYAQYKNKVGWRNSVRHNLSLNECFIKAGRCESGKGNYWAIHPANFDDFARGDFRRRHARNRVRKSRFQLPRVGPPPPAAAAANSYFMYFERRNLLFSGRKRQSFTDHALKHFVVPRDAPPATRLPRRASRDAPPATFAGLHLYDER